jgi:hypothetical protein
MGMTSWRMRTLQGESGVRSQESGVKRWVAGYGLWDAQFATCIDDSRLTIRDYR